MDWSHLTLAMTLCFANPVPPPAPKQYIITLTVGAGDRAVGGKILAEPKLCVAAGRPASFFSGGRLQLGGDEIEHGIKVRLVPHPAACGKTALSLAVDLTDSVEETEETARTRTTYLRRKRILGPGDVMRFSLERPNGQPAWGELTVTEVAD